MKRLLTIFAIFFSLNVFSQTIITESSIVKFNASNLLFTKVNGSFSSIEGEAFINESDLKNAHINAQLVVNTLYTGNKKRDEHLKEEYYFDVANYPTITFSSINIQKRYNQLVAKGELTIKGISKFVSIPFRSESIDENTKRLIGKLEVKRKDFNLGADTGDFLVGEKISIEIDCLVNINKFKEEKEIEKINPIKKSKETNITGAANNSETEDCF